MERSVVIVAEANETPEQTLRRSEAARRRRSAQQQFVERQQRKTLMLRLGIAAAVIALIAIAAFVILSRRSAEPPVVGGVQTYSDLSREHTTDPVTYPQQPPIGGAHDPTWQNCGYYATPVRNENAVHSLEHGAIWITYRPDLPQAQIDALRDLATTQTYILVSPMEILPGPIVASAWGKQLVLDSPDDARLADFIRRYRLDPTGPEPGAPCTGGTSATS
jgi:hypothetical protein